MILVRSLLDYKLPELRKLHIYFSSNVCVGYSLDNKDGNTKQRVQDWQKHLTSLSKDQANQVKVLGGVGKGEVSAEGRTDFKHDFFGLIVQKIQKDIDDLVQICQKLMTLNMMKAVSNKDQNDKNWQITRQNIKNESMKVFQHSADSSKLTIW